jgi:cellulose biosynthesis protein BcsQ
MRGVAIVSTKGGVGKTSLSHLIALGAAWRSVPAYVMHTDERAPISVRGRPYMYYDARDPETLSRLIGAAINQDGLCIIDSGGNRPEFDKWIARSVDLALIPVTPDPEAVNMSLEHMARLEGYGADNVRFILNMVSSNRNERLRDHTEYFSRLPEDKVIGRVSRVSAVKRLREADVDVFPTPPTNVNNLSRTLHLTVKAALDVIVTP